jgi:uroporphyrinogen-III synthase
MDETERSGEISLSLCPRLPAHVEGEGGQASARANRAVLSLSLLEGEPVQAHNVRVETELAPEINLLHEITSRMAAADPFPVVLSRVVHVVSLIAQCDACFIFVMQQDGLVLRASKNPDRDVVDRLTLSVGPDVAGWVAGHRQPVAIGRQAFQDPRFQLFNELPEERYEAFLSVPVLSRGKLVAVINVQHRQAHDHSGREIRLISTVGFLVGAEIELARLEAENSRLSERLEAGKVVNRAKGILQRELGITEEDAYLTIQRQSRERRKTKKEIAEAIIIGDELRRGRGVRPKDVSGA